MGHHLNFYMVEQDLRELESNFKALGTVFINYFAADAMPALSESIVGSSYSGPGWFAPCLTHPDFLAGVAMREVPAQGYWVIDMLSSPVVELIRGAQDLKTLKPGRLWYESSYYGAQNLLTKKPEQFLKWAESVFRTTKRVLSYERALRSYIGSHAKKWQAQSGGHFSPN